MHNLIQYCGQYQYNFGAQVGTSYILQRKKQQPTFTPDIILVWKQNFFHWNRVRNLIVWQICNLKKLYPKETGWDAVWTNF